MSKEDELIKEIKYIAEKCNEKQREIEVLEGLLKACRPYVERSYERTKYKKSSYIETERLLYEINEQIGYEDSYDKNF